MKKLERLTRQAEEAARRQEKKACQAEETHAQDVEGKPGVKVLQMGPGAKRSKPVHMP
jgi:hypothetical protein